MTPNNVGDTYLKFTYYVVHIHVEWMEPDMIVEEMFGLKLYKIIVQIAAL